MAFAFDPDPSVASDTPAGEDPRDPQGSTRIGGEKSAIWESIKQLGDNGKEKWGGFGRERLTQKASMYGILDTYTYMTSIKINQMQVNIDTIHGWYGRRKINNKKYWMNQ